LSLRVALIATVVLTVVIWLAAPALRHFPGALMPWPAHGMVFALLLSSRRADHRPLAAALVVATAAGILLGGGSIPHALAGGVLLTLQGLLVTLRQRVMSDC
jgi:hypothetical protein